MRDLKKDNKSVRAAAKELRISHATLFAWLSGRSVPSPVLRPAIEHWSGGRVKSGEWKITAREKQLSAQADAATADGDHSR